MISSAGWLIRARLPIAVALALTCAPGALLARTVSGGSATVRPGDALEEWRINDDASLIVSPGAATLDIDLVWSRLAVRDGASVTGVPFGVRVTNNSQATISGATITATSGIGFLLTNAAGESEDGVPSSATITGSQVSGARTGASVDYAGTLTTTSTAINGTGAAGVGLLLQNGNVALNAQSSVSGVVNGVVLGPGSGTVASRTLTVDASTISGQTGAAIVVQAVSGGGAPGVIALADQSTVSGGSGTAIDVAAQAAATVTSDASTVQGDVRVADGGSATYTAQHGSTIDGAMNGNVALALDASQWNMTSSSSISSLSLSGGGITMVPAPDTHRDLTVRGDLSGTGGAVTLNTVANAGGALAAQTTDRLIVQGSVTTTGPTMIHIVATGEGALTDRDRNGLVSADEGISIVQVEGASRPDAFELAGRYVVAGPYQYTLHAFGPGQADPQQAAQAGANVAWDYRLANRFVCEHGCEPGDPPPEPEVPGPGDPADPVTPVDPTNPVEPGVPPPDERPAVVVQLPSYLTAPAAMLNYGDALDDGLHQRLGDIRNGVTTDSTGGELFARYLSGQFQYTSSRSFTHFGYDFSQQINALQVGGSLLTMDADGGTLRAGWAVDRGTTRVTPDAADGESSARYTANGVAAWITWQQGNGLWIDAVAASTRYHGDVGTNLGGADVGHLRATGTRFSIESGLPFALGSSWTLEPIAKLSHQSLALRSFEDTDGLVVRPGTARQNSARLGALLSWAATPMFAPYAQLDITQTKGGNPSIDVAADPEDVGTRFGTGRVGRSYRTSLGATSQLGRHVQLYGNGTWEHGLGGYGMRGWSGNVGLRVDF